MTSNLIYEPADPLSHEEAEMLFKSGDANVVAKAIIALGLHDHDWLWVQNRCLHYLSSGSETEVSAALVALGHTARVNKMLDLDIVIPAILSIAVDSRFTGKASDAIDDIRMYVK